MEDSQITPSPEALRVFGRYLLIEKIGEGGMAEVYRAELQGMGGFARGVALKIVHPFLARQARFSELFISEARLGGCLDHPNVVDTLDFGEHDGRQFLAMEYVDGATLEQMMLLERGGRLVIPLEVSLQILVQVCHGLDYAHQGTDRTGRPLYMIHRDMKPSNILLGRHGQVKIADFGVARADTNVSHTMASGVIKGTARYMSPEQAYGERGRMDRRSDLFSVGIILYELVAKHPLYRAATSERLLRQAQDADIEPRLGDLPEGPLHELLLEFLKRALAREPEDRFGSAGEMAEELERMLLHLPERIDLAFWLRATCRNVVLPGDRFSTSPSNSSSIVLLDDPATMLETLVEPGWSASGQGALPTAHAEGSGALEDFGGALLPDIPDSGEADVGGFGGVLLPDIPDTGVSDVGFGGGLLPDIPDTGKSGAPGAFGGVLLPVIPEAEESEDGAASVQSISGEERDEGGPGTPLPPTAGAPATLPASSPRRAPALAAVAVVLVLLTFGGGYALRSPPGSDRSSRPPTILPPTRPSPPPSAVVSPSPIETPVESAQRGAPAQPGVEAQPGTQAETRGAEPTPGRGFARPADTSSPVVRTTQKKPFGPQTFPGSSTALKAALALNSRPRSTIKVDGRPVGVFPIERYEVKAGLHKLEFHPEAGEPYKTSIYVEAGTKITCMAYIAEKNFVCEPPMKE